LYCLASSPHCYQALVAAIQSQPIAPFTAWLESQEANLVIGMPRTFPLFALLLVVGLGLFIGVAASSAHNSVYADPLSQSSRTDISSTEPGHCRLTFRVAAHSFCTHGADPAPTGFATEAHVQPIAQAAVAPAAIICDGDGVSGKRVQVLYVHAADEAERYAAYLPSIRTWAAQVDAIFAASAQTTGGQRHLRFVTNNDCQIDVPNVTIPANADAEFADTVVALTQLGYDSPDRKYLLFVDATVYCGTATIQYDSQPSAANANEHTPGYARVDSGCWDAKAAAHELTHTLGGVQDDAPHSSHGWHCTDEHDIMCYSDLPHFPTVTFPCQDLNAENLLDCDHNDYFHTAPPSASYLASHWNIANSHFLIPGDTPSRPPTVTLLAPQTDIIYQMPITLTLVAQATGRDNDLQRLELYNNAAALVISTTTILSYTWSNVPPGIYTLQAKAYDEVGNTTSAPAVQFMVTDTDDSVGGQGGGTLLGIQHIYLPAVSR
jgi:hypothetical protein